MLQTSVDAVTAWLNGRAKAPIGLWVLALGAIMTLGYAPFGLWPLAVLSLSGLWWLVRHAQSQKQAMGAALVWGLGFQVTALYWLPWAFFKDAGGSWAAALGGGIPAVLGLACYGALAFVLVAALSRAVTLRHGAVWGGASFALGWIGIEFLKGLHPMGFPWLPLGAMWGNSLYLMQLASVGGVWLLSLILITMALLLHAGRRGVTAAAALLVATFAFGYGRISLTPDVPATEMVRVVQPNIQSAHKWDAQKRWQFLQETMAVALAGDTVPPTVIMPETAVAFYLDEEDDVRQALTTQIAAKLPPAGGLVTGTVRRDVSGGAEHYFNSMTVLDTKGVLRSMYDKRLLVPFGEYIPGRSALEALPLPMTLRTMSQSRIDFTHGTRSPLLQTPAGYAVGLICYEGIFPLQVAEAAAEARYLINITNDGWFTGTIALYQHAALTRLRAVETGLPLVRVANTGITLVFDGLGREIARLPINTATHADVMLPDPLPPTWLVRLTAYITSTTRK